MQIKFEPKKIKASKAYVDKLTPIDAPRGKFKIKDPQYTLLKRVLNFLFK